ncbi:unnamed protein product [Schistosoma margrebowiei]|uniref:Uncharacterized protein n=1 Tax=Schistosoma margrebowiei TaxID=48269 RepID=A0A183MBL8_9TREM|nr:unnamed protein product [Schistosoma margrebowiei]
MHHHRSSKDVLQPTSKKRRKSQQLCKNNSDNNNINSHQQSHRYHHQQQRQQQLQPTDSTDFSPTFPVTSNKLKEKIAEGHPLLVLESTNDEERYHDSNEHCDVNDDENNIHVNTSKQRQDHDEESTLTEVTTMKCKKNNDDKQFEETGYEISKETTDNMINPDLEEWIKSSWVHDSSGQENISCTMPESSHNFQLQNNPSACTFERQDLNTIIVGRNQHSNRPHKQRRSSKPPAPPPPFKQPFNTATSDSSNLL